MLAFEYKQTNEHVHKIWLNFQKMLHRIFTISYLKKKKENKPSNRFESFIGLSEFNKVTGNEKKRQRQICLCNKELSSATN